MATAFTLGLEPAKTFAPAALKKDLTTIVKGFPNKEAFFADEKWSKKNNSQWAIKVGEPNFAYLKKTYKLPEKTKKVLHQPVNGFQIKWMLSSKKANTNAADAKTTRMQELGSAWIMRRAINDNIRYKDWQDIRRDKKYPELVKIYPAVDDSSEWLQGYYAQQKRMLEEFANEKFTEYVREGGFMDYISHLVAKKFGISKKDTWNPADIWLIQNEKKVMTEIDKLMAGNKTQTIIELNAILRKMFKNRVVVGISLKKVSGKVARYEEFNVSDTDLGTNYTYNYVKSTIALTYNKDVGEFGTQDTKVVVGGHGSEYQFQIKGNDSAGMSNLKFEPTAKGATSARVGKAPVDMVQELMKDNKMKFVNNHNLYPKTVEAFNKESTKYVKMFDFVKTKVETRINNSKEFQANILAGLTSSKSNHIAVSKLMQIHFLYELLNLDKKSRDQIMTDMVFIASKKGVRFGPFGKLY